MKDQAFNSRKLHHPGTLSKMAYNTATELNAQRWYGGQVLQPITPSTANLELTMRMNDDYDDQYKDEIVKSSNDKNKKLPDGNSLLHTYLRGDAVQIER